MVCFATNTHTHTIHLAPSASQTRLNGPAHRHGTRIISSSAKFAPCCGAKAIRKSKLLKTGMLGALLEIQLRKIWKHQALRTFLEIQSAFSVAGAMILTRCKIRGRRRSSGGLQKHWQAWWWFETMLFAWQAQGFRALWCRCLKLTTLNPWKGCKFHVTEVLLCRDHVTWTSSHLTTWIPNQWLTIKALGARVKWQPNRLIPHSIDNQSTWIWNQTS